MTLKFPQTLDIKIFDFNSKTYILDIYTSAFIELDHITHEMLKRAVRMDTENLNFFLYGKYGYDKAKSVLTEFCELKNKGILLSREEGNRKKFVPPDMYYLTCYSVNLTHDCNLRCKYCYAGEGDYGLPKDYMDISLAEKVADSLIRESGNRKDISVLFFGGEPLLNFDVLKYFVLYTNELIRGKNKKINYTVVTNGTLLTDKVIDFLNNHNIGVQVSLDGPKEIQNFLRPAPNKIGSYDILEKKVKKFTLSRGNRGSVRSTINHFNLDLLGITKHLLNMGFSHIHLEPVTVREDSELYLTGEDMKKLRYEYEKLAEFYCNELKNNHYFGIEGFSNAMSFTHNTDQKVYGCGVGRTFMAVTPRGDIYPCHRLQGMKEWKMGDIYDGVSKKSKDIFLKTFADNIDECSRCWARYYCGGGCIVESLLYNNTFFKPPSWHCEIRKIELELGLQIYSSISSESKGILNKLYS